jgi:acyl-CoA thioesterase-2
MGAILMPQAILAAYKTLPSEFQIHHLAAQFFHAGVYKPTLIFEVSRTSDSKNNAARTVHLLQSGRRIATIAISFIRKPLKDNLSLSYQPRMPEDIDEPDEGLDDIWAIGKGIVQGQALDMVIS